MDERVYLIELASVTHFFAKDNLTYTVADGRSYAVDYSIAELERKLDPKRFVRIHRAVLLNVAWIGQVHLHFGGQMTVGLKDAKQTQLPIARALKERLGLA